jgi:hypothetical protein
MTVIVSTSNSFTIQEYGMVQYLGDFHLATLVISNDSDGFMITGKIREL